MRPPSPPSPSPPAFPSADEVYPLSRSQIDAFVRDGVLVLPGVLSPAEVHATLTGLERQILRAGRRARSRRNASAPDPGEAADLETGVAASSSTHGAGGVLDVFYGSDGEEEAGPVPRAGRWKMAAVENAALFSAVRQLWRETYGLYAAHGGDGSLGGPPCSRAGCPCGSFRHHHGPLPQRSGYAYVDRAGYRLPTARAEELGRRAAEEKGLRRPRPVQKSLAPHLDCCPVTLETRGRALSARAWRPLQSFLALTDAPAPNEGGFEAARGFHRDFDGWISGRARPPPSRKRPDPPRHPCVGEFTPLRPGLDGEALERVAHVAVRAGDAVIWDHRVPHGNARRNDGEGARAVVYVSFLPDVEVNRRYARDQLGRFARGLPPDGGQWHEIEGKSGEGEKEEWEGEDDGTLSLRRYEFSDLGRKVMGIDPW